MLKPLSRALTVSLLATFAIHPAAASQDRPQFRAEVQLVQLQVGVQGPDGQFVSGLGPEDFIVKVDGKSRPAQVAYEIDLRPAADSATAVAAVGPDGSGEGQFLPVAARRHFLLFFDFSFTTRYGVLMARRAAIDFIQNELHPEDLVAVATASRYNLNLVSPFTRDHAQALEAVSTLGLVNATDTQTASADFEESIVQALDEMAEELDAPGGADYVGAALESAEFRDYVASVANYQLRMRAFGQMLQAIEGRKHVVFFSRGFDDRVVTGQSLGALGEADASRAATPGAVAEIDPETTFGAPEIRQGLNDLIDMLRGADAAIYAVDPSGSRIAGDSNSLDTLGSTVGSVETAGVDSGRLTSRTRQSLTALAAGTDGEVYWNRNDLGVVLTDIERRTAAYYLIAYRKEPGDKPSVKLQVQVTRPGVEVVSAPRRLVPPPAFADMTPAQRQLQLAELLNDDVDRRDIDFDTQVVVFPDGEEARVALLLEVPGLELDRLEQLRGDGMVQLELLVLALDDDDEVIDSTRRAATIDVGRLREAGNLMQQSFRYSDYVTVPPGEHRVRVLIRETRAGRTSSRTMAFYGLPRNDVLRVVRPLVVSGGATPVSTADEEGDGYDPLTFDGRRLSLSASPVLQAGQPFRLLVIGYNLPRDAATGEVAAGLVLEAEDAEGNAYRMSEWEIVGSVHDPEHDMTRLLVEARLPAQVPSGSGRLWSRFIDRITGARVEEQAAIIVLGT